MKLYASEEKCS